MNALRKMAAELQRMADDIDQMACGAGLPGALQELHLAELAGSGMIDRKVWVRCDGSLDADWSIWDGCNHHEGKTLAEAMLKWRKSRQPFRSPTIDDVQAEDGSPLPDLNNDIAAQPKEELCGCELCPQGPPCDHPEICGCELCKLAAAAVKQFEGVPY